MDRHDDTDIDQVWREHRRYVLDIAFRMLGNLAEAEDVVQEAYTRLLRVDLDEIDEPRGWLVVVVSRLCLDRLRAQRRHPHTPASDTDDGPGLDLSRSLGGSGASPAGPVADPADRVTLDDSVRLALHLMLERLTPAERTAFVLHDVFQFRFEEIGAIVGRSAAACRQLASRARRTIQSDDASARFTVESAEQRRVTDQFMAACSTGDLAGLLAVLDPEVDGEGDVGGTVGIRQIVGDMAVAAGLLHYLGPDSGTTLLSLPSGDHPGVLGFRDGHLVVLVTISLHEGRIDHIHALVNPAKLAPLARILGS